LSLSLLSRSTIPALCQTASFKDYNFDALGAPVGGGYFHPLLKVRAEFRRILIGMGFCEMPTSRWVESSFWNFDSLFQPQSHPARDAHDTFFIKNPATTLRVPEDYYERVKAMHQVPAAHRRSQLQETPPSPKPGV
jgi:phenylalanyl-tRNA synthetase alpha chain